MALKLMKWGTATAAAAIVCAGLFVMKPAWTVHDSGQFELDGNVTHVLGGNDWTNTSTSTPNVLTATGIIPDAAPASIFTGGGSKDDLDLNGPLSGAGGWKHKSGSVPDKDDITHAYAVAFRNAGNQLVIYAGADRLDNSGDAFMGFWFFQNNIGLNANGSFSGQHVVGDVLVLANFQGGGTTVNIEVLRWVGTNGNVNGTLQRIAGVAGGTPAKCVGGLANDPYCGITNEVGGEDPPWGYVSKSGAITFPVAAFFELGINITRVFQDAGLGNTPCFASFMAETRSSSSVSAVLKDFVLGSFDICKIAVTKACANPQLINDTTLQYDVTGQVENQGFGTLTNIQVTDNPAFVSGSLGYKNCTTGASVSPASLGGLQTLCYAGKVNLTTNGGPDTVTATAQAGNATKTATASIDCPAKQFSPQLQVTKACTTALEQQNSRLVVKVNVSGTVCNIGDTPLSNVTVQDNVIAAPLLSGLSLGLNACQNFSGTYFPAAAENRIKEAGAPPSTTTIPGLAIFRDTVTATATAPFSSVVPQTAPASCTLCPTCTPDACTGTSCPQSTGNAVSNVLRTSR